MPATPPSASTGSVSAFVNTRTPSDTPKITIDAGAGDQRLSE